MAAAKPLRHSAPVQSAGVRSAKRAVTLAPTTQLDIGAIAVEKSPALALQERLTAEFEALEPKRWSKRATLGFIVLTCGGFWLLVGAAVAMIVRR